MSEPKEILTDGNCSELLEHIPMGIRDIVMDPERSSVSICFEPGGITRQEVESFARKRVKQMRNRFEKCTWQREGHNCDTCNERLERRQKEAAGTNWLTARLEEDEVVFEYDPELSDEGSDPASALGKPAAWLSSAFWKDRIEWLLMVAAGITLLSGWLLEWFVEDHWIVGALYLAAYLTGGYFGLMSGIESLRKRVIDVDLLMILAALGAAYVGAPFEGGMLLFLFALSNVLQNHAMERSRQAIQSLMKLRPSEVMCKKESGFETCRVEDVEVGTVVRVRPGESIALDGVITGGEASIDESSITGESMPVFKQVEQEVFAGTINQNTSFEFRVTRPASDSTLAKIINLVEEAQSQKATTQRFLERAEQHYALGVILFTLGLILLPPLFASVDFSSNFYRAMTVMVVASPCALIISTPAAFLSAIGGAARSGILFKGGAHLERLASVDSIAFDKTGTLTEGRPKVADVMVHAESGLERNDLLRIAAAIEAHSEHPLARAIERYAEDEGIELVAAEQFRSVAGKGASAKIGEASFSIGSPSYFREQGASPEGEFLEKVNELQQQAKTLVMVGKISSSGKVEQIIGLIAIADQLREEAPQAMKNLRKLGIKRLVMLTGDHRPVAESIARLAGVDEVNADLLPEDKVRVMKDLSRTGRIAMVGDGVNDAPALATAHVGIAMGSAGTDVAMETADVVLMSSNLRHLEHAIGLARKSRQIVRQNLVFAISVIVVLVILALTIGIPLPLGVVGHEGSTVLVCLNGLRLLGYRPKEDSP